MHDEDRLRSYLLGLLNEDQADEIERRLLAEGELFELAEAVEGDLLTAALAGELPSPQRGHLLRRLTASPGGRSRLALARGLAVLGRDARSLDGVSLRLLERPAVRAAALAASLALAVGVFQLVTTTAVPGTENGANTIAQALPQVDPAPLLLQLALTGVRSGGSGIPHLEIPAGAPREVRLQLPLDPGETSTSFEVTARDAATREVVAAYPQVTARNTGGRRSIVLSLSSGQLHSGGLYEIEVRGLGPAGDELLGKPTFKVIAAPS
ncbi:MAG TPA: hypothetical protein DD490_10150 [Acidobacteria bacterium]|nr:hypothetical protein [Acidobacteriota bacterium]